MEIIFRNDVEGHPERWMNTSGVRSDSGKLGKLENAMEKINQHIGAEKVYIFAKSV